MNPQNPEDSIVVDDKKKIELLAHLELSVHREQFEAVYLLTEDGSIVQKEEASNLSVDFESLKSTLFNAIKVYPALSELLVSYQDHRIVIRPITTLVLKGGSATIPGVAYIVFILPPTKTYRKVVSDFIRNLYNIFMVRDKKTKPQKLEMTQETKKRFVEEVLKDLDEI